MNSDEGYPRIEQFSRWLFWHLSPKHLRVSRLEVQQFDCPHCHAWKGKACAYKYYKRPQKFERKYERKHGDRNHMERVELALSRRRRNRDWRMP